MSDSTAGERLAPILSVRDLAAAEQFYAKLEFTARARYDGYLILERGGLELHLTEGPDHDPLTTDGMAYLRVADVDAVFDALVADGELLRVAAGGLSSHEAQELTRRYEETGICTRIHEIEDKPWGMREFAVVDPSGNLVRVGSPS